MKKIIFLTGLGICAILTLTVNSMPAKTFSSDALVKEAAVLLDLIEKEGAVFFHPDLLADLRLNICKAIDPEAEIVSSAEAEMYAEKKSGIFYTPGVRVEPYEGHLRVLKVLPGSPAQTAGLAVGAIIEKINEIDTLDMSLPTAVGLLRGNRGESIELHLRPASSKPDASVAQESFPEEIAARRDKLQVLRLECSVPQEPLSGMSETWPLNLAYVKVYGVYPGTGAYLTQQLQEWENANIAGAILDLRSAGGADLQSIAAISELFVPAEQPLFAVHTGHGKLEAEFKAETSARLSFPAIVLIDSATHGASAVVAAILHKSKGAMLIGSPCRYDLAIREPIVLPGGEVLYMAVKKISLSADLEENELNPDVLIQATVSTSEYPVEKSKPDIFKEVSEQERQEQALNERIGKDAALRRAADILLGLRALGLKP